MVIKTYLVPWTVRNGKIYHYEEVMASHEYVAIRMVKRIIHPIKHTIWVNGIVVD